MQVEDLKDIIYNHSQHHIDNIDKQLRARLQTTRERVPYNTDAHPFPIDTDGETLLMAFYLEYYRATYHPGLSSKESWERIRNIPKALDSVQDKPYILSLTQRIKRAADQKQIKELYIQIPRDLCEKALTKLGHFSRAQANDITPGPKPAQQRLAQESHKVLYRLSLLWSLSQTLVDEITTENGFSLHPFLKTKTPGKFLELPADTTPTPTERLTAYNTATSTTHTAAIPIKPRELLELSDNHKEQNPPQGHPLSLWTLTKKKFAT